MECVVNSFFERRPIPIWPRRDLAEFLHICQTSQLKDKRWSQITQSSESIDMECWRTIYMIIILSVFKFASSNGILKTKQAMHVT
jgi:hypothetical protein